MKKIIASILSFVSLLAPPTNCSFAKEIQPAETSKHTASVGKNNARKKSEQEKYINKMYENEKKYSDSVNKEIEKVKNMSEKELKRYLNKSYLIKVWSQIRPFIRIVCWGIFEHMFITHFLEPYWNKTFYYAYEKGFNVGQNIKKDSDINDPEALSLIADIKKGLCSFINNFHPDVISKKAKDPTFFDKIYSELELLYNKTKYFCSEDFSTETV